MAGGARAPTLRENGGAAVFRRVLVLLPALAAVAAGAALAAPSPLGVWKAQNHRIYRWIPYQGGYEELALTAHRTPKNNCAVHVNEPVYRYTRIAGGHYRVTAKIWHKSCSWDWEYDQTIAIAVAPTRMTLSCDKEWTKICWTYTRTNADTQAPVVQALVSAGKAGGDASLRYTVRDDSGRTHEELTLYAGTVHHYKTTLGTSLAGHVYAYKLTGIPATLTGTFRWCVRSFDAAGNASARSCSTLTVTA